MSGSGQGLSAALRKRLEELRTRRAEIERRHAELQRMLDRTANEYVRTGGAMEELEYQLELAGEKHDPPAVAEGGES